MLAWVVELKLSDRKTDNDAGLYGVAGDHTVTSQPSVRSTLKFECNTLDETVFCLLKCTTKPLVEFYSPSAVIVCADTWRTAASVRLAHP